MTVILKSSAAKDLDRLPDQIARRIADRLQGLEQDPFPPNSKKLSGRNNTYRLRVGDYRVVYIVNTPLKQIFVTKVRHRKDVYR